MHKYLLRPIFGMIKWSLLLSLVLPFLFFPAVIWMNLSIFFVPPIYQLFVLPILGGSFIYFITAPTPEKIEDTGAHGSAKWGSDKPFQNNDSGLLIGRSASPEFSLKKDSDNLLRFDGEGHLLTVAKTRSGKGVGSVIPNLLTYPGSVVVTDLKGENFAVTADRRKDLGQQVAGLDPFDLVGGQARFNPLDIIDPDSDDAMDDANMIADMLIIPENTSEPFWNKEAHALVAGLILYVCKKYDAEKRTLAQLRHLLTLHPDEFENLLNEMLTESGLIRRAASRLLQKSDKERSGVISSAQSHTHFLDSPRMERITSVSSFDMSDLKNGRLSLFFILPPDRLDSYKRWMRLMISCSLLAVIRSPGKPKQNVLFLLDEFANLGKMEPITRAYSLLAGYGASLWIFLQNLSQLKNLYRDNWETFIGNSEVLQAFGTNDKFTAEYISNKTGQATVKTTSTGKTRGSNKSVSSMGLSHGRSKNISETDRRLKLPDEVMRLPENELLLFVGSHDPVKAEKIRYYTDKEFEGLYGQNPQHKQV